jgi:hypothetical protein
LALHGTLETFPLTDALRLLATTHQSGRLQVQAEPHTGSASIAGSVWMAGGAIVTADSNRLADAPAEEVLADLFRWRSGAFVFNAGTPPAGGQASQETERLITTAGRLVEEWDELQTTVPSLDARVDLVGRLPGDSVEVDAERWAWLGAVGAGATVRDLACRIELTELGVLRVVRDLLDLGVVTVTVPEG